MSVAQEKRLSIQDQRKLDNIRNATKAYKEHYHDDSAIREAYCLKEIFPAICLEIREGDLIAGRIDYDPGIIFNVCNRTYDKNQNELIKKVLNKEPLSDKDLADYHKFGKVTAGYGLNSSFINNVMEKLEDTTSEKREVQELVDFWDRENTRVVYGEMVSDEIKNHISPREFVAGYVHIFHRIACASLDFGKLLTMGLPDLKAHIEEHQKTAQREKRATALYGGMLISLDVIESVCKHWEKEALTKAYLQNNAARKEDLLTIAEALAAITERKPSSLHEAIQLMWIYTIMSGIDNYGRMDIYFGDFYVNDVNAGRLTEAEAERLLSSLWRMIADLRVDGKNGALAQGRVILGGKGRKNRENADAFAKLALEVTRKNRLTEPQTTLRFYKGQDPELMELALDCIGEGGVYPILYNDDVNIPAIEKLYNTTHEDAEQYIPVGCGEFTIEGKSINSPNAMLNYVTPLQIVLRNGRDPITGLDIGLKFGGLERFRTFDDLLTAYKKQISFTTRLLALRHATELKSERKSAAFLFMSMLNDDCITRGKSLVDGGIRYNGGMIESFGLTNAADSLMVIKKLVYEQKVISLQKMVEILDANFEGYDNERKMMLEVMKYGNDIEEIDEFLKELSYFVCTETCSFAKDTGFDYFTICSMNPNAFRLAVKTKASPDGRKDYEPLAIGNAPTAGRDTSSITALLNSMTKPEPLHSGYVHNLKVTKDLFSKEYRSKLKSLLDTFFERGGSQIMITVVNSDDLKSAMERPDDYKNLIVRVGGWTSRYTTLPEYQQIEILNRTLYES